MQNPSIQKSAEHELDPSSRAIIPPRNHGLSVVTPSYNPAATGIAPTHTPVVPLTHTNLSRKQALVLECLVKNVSRQTNYSSIGLTIGISKTAARDAVLQLVSKGYILPPVTIRDGVFQGFGFQLNGAQWQQFLETVKWLRFLRHVCKQ